MKNRNVYRTTEEKLRILILADKCNRRGQIKALLQKEKLSSSTLSAWRKKRLDMEVAVALAKVETTEILNSRVKDLLASGFGLVDNPAHSRQPFRFIPDKDSD